MDLSLIIPLWNDAIGVRRILAQAQDFGVFSEIIICDDASDEALQLESWEELSPAFRNRIVYLRNDVRMGAGHARNMGLSRVTCSHLIFFDADDLFEDDFLRIIADLGAHELGPIADFCIFRHNDTRLLDRGETGSFSKEEKLWEAVGASEELQQLTEKQAAILCGLAAYPWNKIYRTAFLRQHSIRCTELPVHNDIELHWSSFISAEVILCCSILGARHYVAEDGLRLTNNRSEDRLRVFEAFSAICARISHADSNKKINFVEPLMVFARNLISWIKENIEDEHKEELVSRSQRFFLENLDSNRMTLIAYQNPALAHRINNLLIQGRV